MSAAQNALATGVFYLQLDNLDEVELALGESAADDYRSRISDYLTGRFGVGAVSCRVGAQGFFILLRDHSQERCLQSVNHVLDDIATNRLPSAAKGWSITGTAGLAWQESPGTLSLEELRRRALVASADARTRRTAREIYRRTCRGNELSAKLVCDLGLAMKENRLRLMAQEIVRVAPASGDAKQYEVLVQLVDQSGQIRGPVDFVPFAEHSYLVEMLDRWIIHKALVESATKLHENSGISLSLNLSGRSIASKSMWTFIESCIQEAAIEPSRIQFEITETSEIADMSQAAENVRTARRIGCDVALDDFGAGLSSYVYLKNLPVNVIKIDGALIPNAAQEGSVEAEIVGSIVKLAARLRLRVVAEHVSSPRILDALTALGVTSVQGYELAEPVQFESIFVKS